MKLSLISCFAVSALLMACSGATPVAEAPAPQARAEKGMGAKQAARASKPTPVATADAQPTLQVGDYFVQRFSGSFTKEDMILTERVVAREKRAFVIDFTLEQGKRTSRLRLRVDAQDPRRILQVSELAGDTESASNLAAYEALMARTLFAPDENEERTKTEASVCLIGEREVECQLTEYRVRVGEKSATLTVMTSQAAGGRDLGGEVTSADGKLLYRAQLIEAGSDAPAAGFASRK